MKTQLKNRSSQAGIVMVLMTIGMVVLVGVSGLALDMGHTYLMKTRLQNALDAAALSGAQTLKDTGDTVQAEIDARSTFVINAGDDMNDPGLISGVVVEFSDTLFNPLLITSPQYVRVSLRGYQLPMWFAQVLPAVGDNKEVGASAVAGPSPTLIEVCDLMPMMVCGDPAGDDDCTDGSCFGFSYAPNSTDEITLKIGSDVPSPVGDGNFQLIRLDGASGGFSIRQNMAGSFNNCINTDDDLETEPGNTVGPVFDGINTRFGIHNGSLKDTEDIYKTDKVYLDHSHSPVSYYSDYVANYASGNFDPLKDGHEGGAKRRVVTVPIGDCTVQANGQDQIPLLGVACFFLTRPAGHTGSQEIRGQIVPGCQAHGTPGPDPFAGPGPDIIQLYKNPASGDA